ncbi:MAG: chemotaxis protein CheA [Lachnospiraceae bacterium]|nr:chemotaxis protein CheA [Lachnospiraceae bacterium]
MDNKEYYKLFLDEANDNMAILYNALEQLSVKNDDENSINEAFRACHSLKGMSATMHIDSMNKVSHGMENALHPIRDGKFLPDAGLMELFMYGADLLYDSLQKMKDIWESTGEFKDVLDKVEGKSYINKLMEYVEAYMGDSSNTGGEKTSTKDNASKETVEIPSVKASADDSSVTVPSNENNYNIINTMSAENKIALKEATPKYKNVFIAKVLFDDKSIFMAARALQVFNEYQNVSGFICSYPEIKSTDNDDYKNGVEYLICTNEESASIKGIGFNVGEVSKVNVYGYDEYVASLNDKKSDMEALKSTTMRVDIKKLDEFMGLINELVTIKNGMDAIDESGISDEFQGLFAEKREQLDNLTTSMYENILQIRMFSVNVIFDPLKRTVRDLCRKLNKKINLTITGGDTEIDKFLADELVSPMLHLIRNAADHGIESPEEREALNKPKEGNIKIAAYQNAENIIIEVIDDGRGISIDHIKEKLIKRAILTEEEVNKLSDDEAINYIFETGFSTSDKVTDISGRGVGLDVVKKMIEETGGNIKCKSEKGVGTEFAISLPLTMLVVPVLLIGVKNEDIGEEIYALPVSVIESIKDFADYLMIDLEGKPGFIYNDDEDSIPLLYLSDLITTGDNREKNITEETMVIVVNLGRDMIALAVDSVIGQQNVVIKKIPDEIGSLPIISGATVLGNGRIALLIDLKQR